MVNLFANSKIHQTYHQTKKIRRHRRKLKKAGVERCHVVSTYPKSGNTWVARMLADAICCEMVGYLSDVHERVPRESNHASDALLRNNVVARSHHTVSLLTLGGIELNEIVTVVRDPRDVAVSGSGFLFESGYEPNKERIDQMIDQMVESKRPSVRWQDMRWDTFVQSAIDKDAFILRYVDILNDTMGAVREILARLGYERSDRQIERVVQYHSFEASKARMVGVPTVRQYFRRGKAGAFSEYLTPRQQKRIEDEFRPVMERLGYL